MPIIAFRAPAELVAVVHRMGIEPNVFAREAFEIQVRRLMPGEGLVNGSRPKSTD